MMRQKRNWNYEFPEFSLDNRLPRKRRLLSDYFKNLSLSLDRSTPRFGNDDIDEDVNDIGSSRENERDSGNESEESYDSDTELGSEHGRKFFIPKKFLDPLGIVKGDASSEKELFDRIRNSSEFKKDEDEEEVTLKEEDAMDLDDVVKKKKQKHSMGNAEMYYQKYIDMCWSLVKYYDYKWVVYRHWDQWMSQMRNMVRAGYDYEDDCEMDIDG